MAERSGTAAVNTRKSVWRCNRKYDGESTALHPIWMNVELENAFVTALTNSIKKKKKHMSRWKTSVPVVGYQCVGKGAGCHQKLSMPDLIEDLRSYMVENTRRIQDQGEYNRRFAEMDASCQKAEEQVNSLQKQLLEQHGQRTDIPFPQYLETV